MYMILERVSIKDLQLQIEELGLDGWNLLGGVAIKPEPEIIPRWWLIDWLFGPKIQMHYKYIQALTKEDDEVRHELPVRTNSVYSRYSAALRRVL